MYEIKTSKVVDKFLEKHLDVAKKFIISLELLKVSPFENNLDIKPLKGIKNLSDLEYENIDFCMKLLKIKSGYIFMMLIQDEIFINNFPLCTPQTSTQVGQIF